MTDLPAAPTVPPGRDLLPSFRHLEVSDGGGQVATITLSRPERLNALNRSIGEELSAALDAIGTPRALVFSGKGRAFSVGWDLVAASMGVSEEADWVGLNERVAALPFPTVAAIDGYCLGGGLALAMSADLRVASTASQLGFPEVLRGTFPGMGCTWRLPRLIGAQRAKQLMLFGQLVDATSAERWGLVDVLTEPGEARTRAARLAEDLAVGAPVAQRAIKTLIDANLSRSLADALAGESEVSDAVSASWDAAEGIRAFVEKRPARFEGR